jgi:hypothetical protein
MDREYDLAHRIVDIDDDIGDQRAEQMLASAHRHIGRVPSRGQIGCQICEGTRIDLDVGWSFNRWPRFHIPYAAERRLPVLLQLRGDEAIIRIAGSVTTLRETGFVAGLLQFQIVDVLLILLSFPMHPLRLERGFDCYRLYRPK